MTLGELRAELDSRLADPVEVRILLEEATGQRAAQLVLGEDVELEPTTVRQVLDAARRRRAGEPLQHVVGHWSFRKLELLVDQRALIPRPETELVVEVALRALDQRPFADRALRLADLGTGTGAIALSLVSERADVEVFATDQSSDALSLALANAANLDAFARDRVHFFEGDWYRALPETVLGGLDCIISNPPYLSEQEWHEVDPVVRDFDPRSALVAGPSGTEAIAEVIAGAPGALARPGVLVVEIGWSQGEAVRTLATAAGFASVAVERDLNGRDRILVASF